MVLTWLDSDTDTNLDMVPIVFGRQLSHEVRILLVIYTVFVFVYVLPNKQGIIGGVTLIDNVDPRD